MRLRIASRVAAKAPSPATRAVDRGERGGVVDRLAEALRRHQREQLVATRIAGGGDLRSQGAGSGEIEGIVGARRALLVVLAAGGGGERDDAADREGARRGRSPAPRHGYLILPSL